jgi:CHAD domain-containing protein
MATPRPVRGLRASIRVRDAAPVFLAARLADVEQHRKAVERRLSPGAVHDLRVSLRRLRGALRLFGKRAAVRKATAEVRRFQGALGPLRDLHVQLARLTRLQSGLAAEEAAVVAQVRAALNAGRASGVESARSALLRWARRGRPLLARLDGLRPRGKLGGHRLRNGLVRQLEVLEDRVGAALADPGPEAMHRLRIAVKRFRYGLEFLEPAMPAETADIRTDLVPLQTALGDLHDLDVQIALVDRHAARDALPPAADLLRRLAADREREAGELTAALVHWEEEATALRAQVLLASSPIRGPEPPAERWDAASDPRPAEVRPPSAPASRPPGRAGDPG